MRHSWGPHRNLTREEKISRIQGLCPANFKIEKADFRSCWLHVRDSHTDKVYIVDFWKTATWTRIAELIIQAPFYGVTIDQARRTR